MASLEGGVGDGEVDHDAVAKDESHEGPASADEGSELERLGRQR